MGKVFDNAWDCRVCGLKGINAREHKTCPQCGAPEPGSEYEYIPDKEHPLTNYVGHGPDWTCHYCGVRNPATRQTCSQCGNARSDEDATIHKIDYGTTPPRSSPELRLETTGDESTSV